MNKFDLWFDSKQFATAFVAATGDPTSAGKKSKAVATARLERGAVSARVRSSWNDGQKAVPDVRPKSREN
jgi:hypothetical protein